MRIKTLAFVTAFLLLLPIFAYPQLATVEVPCIDVVDGDTIKVNYQGRVEKVRLIGVDTPEHRQQGFEEAKAFATLLVMGKTVRLEFDNTLRDRYSRLLAYVYLPDGRMLNEELIRHGYSGVYDKYPFKYLERFRQIEREAREAGRGLGGGTRLQSTQQNTKNFSQGE